MADGTKKLIFHYIKSPSFETRRVDGVYGGLTAGLEVFLATFSERPVIPETEVYMASSDHLVQIPEERISKKGIVREVQSGMTMSLEVARDVVKFMQERIEMAEKMRVNAEQTNANRDDR